LPVVRSFRALRYRPEAVSDLASVVAPPYDVISTGQHRKLLAREARNVVRLDLPEAAPGEDPDDRYRQAARTLAAWRSDGTLHKEPRPAMYAYEQAYRVPGSEVERRQRGFFGRLRLESFGPESGVLPHERTLAGPREDRYRLLRATGVNTSPVVGLFPDADGTATELLDEIARRRPDIDVLDDDGVRHRLWVVLDDGTPAGEAARLANSASRAPITIADGHHRYETALRYRDERRMSRSCEEDPAFDYILMHFLPASEQVTVLPTHRVARDVPDPEGLIGRATTLFDVHSAERPTLEECFGSGASGGGRGQFGLWTRAGGALLAARPEAFDPLLGQVADEVRRLDVTMLGAALDALCGIPPDVVTAGDRIAFTKSASEAIDWVEARRDGADVAFLLEPTPVASVMAVAAAGEMMPQKSTYFYPKALTGLVINPHEW
jgi:uncharacterized protein (DUF1015 family)